MSCHVVFRIPTNDVALYQKPICCEKYIKPEPPNVLPKLSVNSWCVSLHSCPKLISFPISSTCMHMYTILIQCRETILRHWSSTSILICRHCPYFFDVNIADVADNSFTSMFDIFNTLDFAICLLRLHCRRCRHCYGNNIDTILCLHGMYHFQFCILQTQTLQYLHCKNPLSLFIFTNKMKCICLPVPLYYWLLHNLKANISSC